MRRSSVTKPPMHSTRSMSLLLLLAALAGCARDNVIVDTKGADMSRYPQDKAECEAYADQVSTGNKVARGAGLGAVVGAVTGAAAGAIFGDSTAAARGATVGAIGGGTSGAVGGGVEGENGKDRVLRNCLSQRGYRVLN